MTLIAAALAIACNAPAAEEKFVEYSGVAHGRHGATSLYGERHWLAYHDGRLSERLVLYTCPDGAAFARKAVSYVDQNAPDFLFDDASSGMREGVRSDAGQRTVFFRANRVEPEKRMSLIHAQNLVVDAGFDEFIRSQWSLLMDGGSVPLRFLVPSRLQPMNFDLQHLRSAQEDGRAAEVFRLKLSGFYGMILPAIEVTYDAMERVLVRYEGITDLRDASGDNYQAIIRFKLNDRKPSSAQAYEAALHTGIAPCR